ncbi:MAG: sulfatase-like hydrolase/transferase [Gammaproteobacteria bacterium]|nr:sulfatase-like hydrolase/transferase [Gammaproteobacteria bacterium]
MAALVACGSDDGGGAADKGSESVRSDPRPNIIIVFTDDQGYADIGAQSVVTDIRTPNIDRLATTGVRMTDGYVTAPQCTPSRAALMSGRYQQKFGVDDNKYTPFPLDQPTLPEKLVAAGYKTGMVGKWHLGVDENSEIWYQEVYAPGSEEAFSIDAIPAQERVRYYPESRGFQETFFGYRDTYRANFNLSGELIPYSQITDTRFRVDVVSDAAVTFIDRHKDEPFFLYVPYFAPHVPLEATETYLSRFPGEMPERRRYALAMLSAVDDGVGRIMQTLENYGLEEDTLVFFISDNGAPLDLGMEDVLPVSLGGTSWDGSLNDPWVGEKGMLTEGAVRVPFIVNWKGHLPEGLVYRQPVMSIDASATAASVAGLITDDMDGVDLIPYLKDTNLVMDRALFWRFLEQAAIRRDDWKYLYTGIEGEYLFDLSSAEHEQRNLIAENPQIAASLRQELTSWAETLKRPGLSGEALSNAERKWYDYYFGE